MAWLGLKINAIVHCACHHTVYYSCSLALLHLTGLSIYRKAWVCMLPCWRLHSLTWFMCSRSIYVSEDPERIFANSSAANASVPTAARRALMQAGMPADMCPEVLLQTSVMPMGCSRHVELKKVRGRCYTFCQWARSDCGMRV